VGLSIDELRKLQQKKYRSEFGCFIAEGEHLVLELEQAAVHKPALRASELYVSGSHEDWPSGLRKHVITTQQMARICDTSTPQGIFAVVPIAALQKPLAAGSESHNERSIYLHEIQDPGNLGTILRTLAWFGGFRCLLSPGSVDPFNPKVVRASMGALFHVPLELQVPLASLAANFSRIACLDMEGRPLADPLFGTCDCYIFGNEARGVPRDDAHTSGFIPFTIPGSGAIESLNLATVVNMSVYELMRSVGSGLRAQ
jgi:TrmH family RNA methyltransferase